MEHRPRTKRRTYLRDNVAAAVRLSPTDLEWVDRTFQVGAASGDRYGEQAMKVLDV